MLQRWRALLKPTDTVSLLPLLLLLLALPAAFIFGEGRNYLMRHYDSISASSLTQAANLSPQHNFLLFYRQTLDDGGRLAYEPYSRYPIGGYALIKLAILPFDDSLTAQIYAARLLMLAFFSAAVILAWMSLSRIAGDGWVALAATLLPFAAYPALFFNAMVGETMFHLFGIMLAFHGMVVFEQTGRCRQLLVKSCFALLLGWHIYALLLVFVTLGLVKQLFSAAPLTLPPQPLSDLLKERAGRLLRSRYLLLGVVTLLFGMGVLAFNLGNEYLSYNGERAFTDLPTVRSALFRVGADGERSAAYAAALAWPNYLEEQLYRVNRMSFPYALAGRLDLLEQRVSTPLPGQSLVMFILVVGGCLCALLWGRQRILLATLVLSGVLWAVAMRNFAAFHSFESVFYIGIPLVLFSSGLAYLRRQVGSRIIPGLATGTAAGLATIAAALFILSAYQVKGSGYDPAFAEFHAEVVADFEVIRELTPGKVVFVAVPPAPETLKLFAGVREGIHYYLSGSTLLFAPQESNYHRADFVITGRREPGPALLTPGNKRIFLYDRAQFTGQYGSLISGEPTARGEFDLYLRGNALTYLKEPCAGEDTTGRFALHLNTLDKFALPAERRQYGFDNLDFNFGDYGTRFEGKCLITVPLPDYHITEIRTGRGSQGRTVFPVDYTDEYRDAYPFIAAGEPLRRSVFDLYLQNDRLYYLKEPCAPVDTLGRFFLHFVPVNVADLPLERQQHGTDNHDFDFAQRGERFDGKCLARATLPDYPVHEIRTGQFVIGGERFWEAFLPVAR